MMTNAAPKKQSEELTRFYKAWLAWAEEGGEGPDFITSHGLCRSLFDYLSNDIAVFDAGLNAGYPFGRDEYLHGAANCTQHLCPKRLQWVRDHLKAPYV